MMNGLRNFCSMLFTAAMVAFASIAGATGGGGGSPELYSLNVSPIGASPIAITIKNESTSGSDKIESFIIKPPTGVTITSLGSPSASASATVKLKSDGRVYVNNFSGLRSGSQTPQSLTVYVNATYGSGASCGASYTWTAKVYEEDDFDDEYFDLVVGNPPTTPTQTVSCQYKVVMSPASLLAGARTSLTATVTNKSAAGGPAITTATLAAPAGVTPKATGLASSSGTATLAGATVTVSGASVAPGGSMTVTIPVDTACAASTGNWTPTASSGSGSSTLSTADSSLGTAVTGACSMAFQQQPTSAAAGVAISPPVIAAVNGAGGSPVPWFTGNVLLTTGSCTSTPIATVAATGGIATFPTVVLTTLGSTTLTACSTLGSTTLSLTSNSFTVYQGTLNCGDNLGTTYTNPGGGAVGTPGYAEGKRWDNKDGSSCVLVDYTFTNTIATDNSVSLTWNASMQPNAVFDYTVFWRPEFVDPATGLPKRRVKVAWETDGLGNPIYVWGNACLSKDPPAVYTTLAAAITDTSTTSVTVNPPAGPLLAVPFAVVIGNERMTVTSVGGGTNWTVVRGAGGTSPATHLASDSVTTTPLPIDPNPTKPGGGANPYAGKQDRMCIWDEEFQSAVPAGTNLYDCSPTSPGYSATSPVACVIRRTSVFDLGDGFMSLDN